MSGNAHTVEENTSGGFDVVAPSGEVVITYPWTSAGGSEHAEMLACADADDRNGEWD